MPVGQIIFPRDPDGRNQGQLMGRRKRIAAIEGLLFLDFETKEDSRHVVSVSLLQVSLNT